jgi:nucleoid-associated protein YejK
LDESKQEHHYLYKNWGKIKRRESRVCKQQIYSWLDESLKTGTPLSLQELGKNKGKGRQSAQAADLQLVGRIFQNRNTIISTRTGEK